MKYKPDLVFTVCPTIFSVPNSLIINTFSKILFQKKVFSWIHYQDLEIEAAFNLKIIKGSLLLRIVLFFEKMILGNFDVISTISYGMMKKLKDKILIKKKLFYLPNFIENKNYKFNILKKEDNPFLKELKLNSNDYFVMYSGTLNEKFSFNALIETIKKLKNQQNILWIISGDGPIKNLLIQKLKNLDNVMLLPFQSKDKLPLWLNLADIHLIPQKISVADLVLPSKLLGILSSSKPVIGFAKKNSDLGKVLDSCGVRLDNEDPELLSNAITNLLEDKKRRMKLGVKGREYVMKNFEKEIVLNQLFYKINDLVNNNK